MSNVQPTLSKYQEPEPGSQLEIGLGALGKSILWALLLVLITGATVSLSLRGSFLDADKPRITQNPALGGWSGLRQIWTRPHQLPDFSPVAYTTFLIEAQLWGTTSPRSATGFRVDNLLIHIAGALALLHLLQKLEIRGAWVAATVFAVHPVNVMAVASISQRPILLGTWFGLLTLIVFFRLLGLNARPDQVHPYFRLPDTDFWLRVNAVGLFLLTLLSSPAIAAVLAPVSAIVIWWERGQIPRRDLRLLRPFVAASGLILVIAVVFSLRTGGGDFALPGSPWWYRPIAIAHQVFFYFITVLTPFHLTYVYEPFQRFGPAAILAVAGLLGIVGGATWAVFRWGRGPAASLGLLVVLLLPGLVWIRSSELYGGWVAVHRLYPASMAIIVPIIFTIGTWLQIRRDASTGLAAIAIALAAAGGMHCAWLNASQQRLWSNVLEKSESNIAALTHLADDAMRQNRLIEAESLIDRAVRTNPNDAAPLVKLGELDELRRLPERARSSYLTAIRIDPKSYEANFGLARCMAVMHDSTGALAQYRRVLDLKPGDPIILNNIGLLHAERGEWARAEDTYRQALVRDPRCTPARVNLANLLYQKGDLVGADRELAAVVDIDRQNFEAFMNAGAMLGQMAVEYQRRGDLDSAAKGFEKATLVLRTAVHLKPEMPAACSNLAMALLGAANLPTTGDSSKKALLGEAVFMFERAAELEPGNASYAANATAVRQLRDAGKPAPSN